jgi:outer membrane protein assembly factor BamB
MNMAQLRPLALAVLVSSVALVGCSRGYKPDIPKPSPLPTLPAQQQTLTQVWSQRIGGANQPDPLRLQIAMDETRYVAINRKGEIEAWSLQGRRLWSRDLAKTELSSGVVLSADRVLVGSSTGQLLALDANTGATVWTRQLSASILTPSLVAGDRVVTIANDGTVTGTALSTGQPVWTFDVQVPAVSIRGNAAPILYNDDTVMLASGGGRLYAVDLSTGVPKWERRVAISQGRSEVQRLIDIDSDPLLSAGQLYVVSYQGQLVALDLEQQRMRWTADTSSLRNLSTSIGNVYVTTTEGAVQAFDEQDGRKVWQLDQLKYRELSNPVVLGRWLVVGDAKGYLHLIEQTEGKIVGRVRTAGAVRYLRVVGDRLLVQSTSGALSVWQAS